MKDDAGSKASSVAVESDSDQVRVLGLSLGSSSSHTKRLGFVFPCTNHINQCVNSN